MSQLWGRPCASHFISARQSSVSVVLLCVHSFTSSLSHDSFAAVCECEACLQWAALLCSILSELTVRTRTACPHPVLCVSQAWVSSGTNGMLGGVSYHGGGAVGQELVSFGWGNQTWVQAGQVAVAGAEREDGGACALTELISSYSNPGCIKVTRHVSIQGWRDFSRRGWRP